MKKYKKIVSLAASAVLAVSLSASAVMAQEQNKTDTSDEAGNEVVENELSDITKETPAVFWDRENGSDKNEGLSKEKPVKSLDAVNDIVEEILAAEEESSEEATVDEVKEAKSSVIVVNLCEDEKLTEDEESKIEEFGLRVALVSDYEKACEEAEDSEEVTDDEDKTETDVTEEEDKTDTDVTEDEDKTETDVTEDEDKTESDVTEEGDKTDTDVTEDEDKTESDVTEEEDKTETDTPAKPTPEVTPAPEVTPTPVPTPTPEATPAPTPEPTPAPVPETEKQTVQNDDVNTVFEIEELKEIKEVMSVTETENEQDVSNETKTAEVPAASEETDAAANEAEESVPVVLSLENEEDDTSEDVTYYAIPGHDIIGTGTSKPTDHTNKPAPTPVPSAPAQTENNNSSSGNTSNTVNSSTVSPVNTGEDSIAFVYAVCMLLSCGALCVFRKISIDNRRAAQKAVTQKEIEEFRKACRLD